MTSEQHEAERIRAEYKRREREIGRDFYALTKPTNLFIRHGQERALLHGLERSNALPLAEKRILEVGCGRGQWLGVLEEFGATRTLLAGIDLDDGRLDETRMRFAGADLRTGDAARLPWASNSFDLVLQSTMFTSILDADVKKQIADEMLRVLAKDGGAIIWYDFRYDNPRNSQVRGIKATELRSLFPGCRIDLEGITLAPPIARRVVPRSWFFATLLERLGLLNTHYMAVICR